MADLTFREIFEYVENNETGVMNVAYSLAMPVSISANKTQAVELGVAEDEGSELVEIGIEIQNEELELLHGRKTPEIVQDLFTDANEEVWQDVFNETPTTILNCQNTFEDTET